MTAEESARNSRTILIAGLTYWCFVLILSLTQAYEQGVRVLTPYGFEYIRAQIVPVFAFCTFFTLALRTQSRNPVAPHPLMQGLFVLLTLSLTYWAAVAPLRPNWLLLFGVWATLPLLYAADVRLVSTNVLLSLGSAFITLSILELLLRPFPQLWPDFARQVGSNWRRLHADIPGLSYEEEGTSYQINEIGFRGGDLVPNETEIIALGDSNTFGVGTGSPWPAQLQELTGAPVLNLGMGGTDPPKHINPLVGFGLERDPTFVLEAYFEGNDFFSCYQPARPKGPRWGDRLILPDVFGGLINTIRQTFNAQRITSALTYNEVTPLNKTINGNEVLLTFSPAYSATLTMDLETLARSENWRIATGSILRLRQLTQDAGATFLLVYIPERTHVYWPLIREDDHIVATLNEDMIYHWKERYGCQVLEPGRSPEEIETFRNTMDLTINDQRQLLTEFARTEGLHFLDLTENLQALAAQGITLHDPLETHYNDFVHTKIAEWIGMEIEHLEE